MTVYSNKKYILHESTKKYFNPYKKIKKKHNPLSIRSKHAPNLT